MGFNRVHAKLQAKAAMKKTYPHPMLVTLVYLLATSVLSWVISLLVANPFTEMLTYLDAGYDPNVVFSYVLRGNRLVLYVFLSVLISLYTTVMAFGYTSYGLRLARGEQPSYRNLLDGFPMAGRVILAAILMTIFLFLWEMVVLIPGMVVMVVLLLAGAEALAALWTVVFMIGVIVFILAIAYRYALTSYFLLDHPDMTALQAITASKQAMRGHKWELFVLELSFLGWAILSLLTLGILGLWVTPYRAATVSNFYDIITGGYREPPSFGPYPGAGPNENH